MMKNEGCMTKDDDFKLLRGFADERTNVTDEQTFVIVESLSRLKRAFEAKCQFGILCASFIVYCHFFSVKFLSSGPELVKVSPNILINSSMSKDIHSNNVSFLSSHIPNVRVNPIVYSV